MKRIISLAVAVLMLLGIAPFSLATQLKDAALDNALNGAGMNLEFTNDSAHPWTVATLNGLDYAKSNIEGIGAGSTTLSVTTTVEAGTVINFDYVISSENNYDKMDFDYVTAQEIEGVALFTVSGERNGTFSYLIRETNEYTFRWTYSKDSALNDGDDSVYIRSVIFTRAAEPTEIDIIEDELEIVAEVPTGLSVNFMPNGTFANLTWESSNNAIATVEDGVVTGHSAGTVTITARFGSLSDTAEITVITLETGLYVEGFRTWSEMGYSLGRIRNYIMPDTSNVTIDLPCALSIDEMSAGAYYDGTIYVVKEETLYAVDYETGEAVSIGECGRVRDMTYDYQNDRMLGLMSDSVSETPYVVEIDITSGAITPVVRLESNLVTLAMDQNGDLYGIGIGSGILYRINLESGEFEQVMETRVQAQFTQSMTFDLSTGLLYWASCSTADESLYVIDVNECTIDEIFTTFGEIIGLHITSEAMANVPVSGITFDTESLSLGLGETAYLNATIEPENATNRRIIWESSNPVVAPVTNNGMVRAASTGTATITATTVDGNYTASCEVTVTGDYVLYEDFEDTLIGWTNLDADGDGYTWMSMKAYSGGAIQAYEGEDMYTSQSYVNGNPLGDGSDDLILNPDNWLISPEFTIDANAESAILSWIAGSQDPQYPDLYSVYIGSGDAVPENFTNEIHGGYAPGTPTELEIDLMEYAGQTVRVAFRHHRSSNNFMISIDMIKVAVSLSEDLVPVTGVTLDTTSTNMSVGDTLTLTATIQPENATNKDVTWSSSNTDVAIVENGTVTAIAKGTAIITVRTANGGFTASCEITVTEQGGVDGITLDTESAIMAVGGQLTINAIITPEDAVNKNIIWTTSDETVATVENGVVSAISVGEVTITATTEDGNFSASCTITVYLAGDVTGDGQFNTGDAVAMLRKIAGLDSENYIAELEDYNADGKFNTGDAVAILRKIAGLE